jgi:hypothetical protein
MVGKNKMKDWKAAVRTWEQKENEHTTRRTPGRKIGPREMDEDEISAIKRMMSADSPNW